MERFEEVYVKHFQVVYRFLLGLSRDPSLAEELAQETFVKAMAKWSSFHGRCAVDTWLCSIGKNLYFSHLRKSKPLPLDQLPNMGGPSTEHDYMSQENEMTLHRHLHGLPEPFKEVFTLRVFADMGYGQIGALFGKTDNWARVTFYRGKVMLRALMKEDAYES